MKSIIRYCILITLVLAAHCSVMAQKPTTPIEVNDHFATLNDTLYTYGQEWGAKLNSIRKNSKAFDSLAPIRHKMEIYIDNKIQELTTMTDIGGSTDFRNAIIQFMHFEKKMIVDGFLPFEKLGKTSTEDEIKKTIDLLIAATEKENEVLEVVQAAQSEYARKNKFTLGSDKD